MNNKIDLGTTNLNLRFSDKIDGYLYHYTTTKIAIESILPTGKLKYTSVSSSNDPLEALDLVHVVSAIDDIKMEKAFEFGRELNRRLKKGYKVCSFCIDSKLDDNYPFNKGYGKSRMWNQYGEDHMGVCLVFSKSRLIDLIQKEIDSNTTIGGFEFYYDKIKYKKNLFDFREMTLLDSNQPAYENARLFNSKLKKYIKIYLFRKLKDYEGEQEYRVALYNKLFEEKKEIFIDFGDALKGIILGSKFNRTYQIVFEKYKERMEFDLFSTFWINGDFNLEQINLPRHSV